MCMVNIYMLTALRCMHTVLRTYLPYGTAYDIQHRRPRLHTGSLQPGLHGAFSEVTIIIPIGTHMVFAVENTNRAY